MVGEKKYSRTKESVFKELKGRTEFNCSEFSIKTVEGDGASIVVSMCAVGDTSISVTMNGEEVLAEIVLFSLNKEETGCSEAST